MAEKQSMSDFERLLQERAQIEQWLKRLSSSSDKTPASVRERVRSDYEKRLAEVQEELNGHRDEISEALERHRSVRSELQKQEREAEEQRAEAELRHTVGEYDDAKWNSIRNEIDGSLGKIREELSGVDGEVAELEAALASITADAGDVDEQPPAQTGNHDLAAALIQPTTDDLPPPIRELSKATPPAPEPPARKQGPAPVDELKFLDLEPEEEAVKPAAAETVPMPPDAAELLGKVELVEEEGAASKVGADGITSFSENVEQPKRGAAKTLKCGECGTMNLPTEWYCERCGAELAAL